MAAAVTTATATAAMLFRVNKQHQKSCLINPRWPPIHIHIHFHKKQHKMRPVLKPTRSASELYPLTTQNVDTVLENVRPYLISDGGNVDVVSVENGVVSLELQGACGSCPSSTTTMKMGIERVLKEKFGDAVKEVVQVVSDGDHQNNDASTAVEVVNAHLDILRPAIKNYGGSVQVLSVEQGGDCVVKYAGPQSIGSGIKAAIKEKFPDIVNVVLTD